MSEQFPVDPTSSAPPVCPRHPDRVAYVRCQRCGRPTCPECQRPAAVGVHCVDCVREANAGVRPQKSVLGATVRSETPYVTITIIALNVLAFIVQKASPSFTFDYGFLPALGELEPWRFLTSAFLHAPTQYTHILFNMYLLWLVGPSLELLVGRARFVALYALTAIAGSVSVLLFAVPGSDSWTRTLVYGASGAVFGLFGVLFVVMRKLKRDVGQILVFVAINGVLGFIFPGISWQGHLGGLLAGLVLGVAFAYAPAARRRLVSWGAIGGLALVLLALSMNAYGQL